MDDNLFVTMVALNYINLNSNKIKFLNSFLFGIPNEKLACVELMGKVCVNEFFNKFLWYNL